MWKCANGRHNAETVTAGLTSAEARLDGSETEFGENRIGLLCIAFVTPQNVINCHTEHKELASS